MTDKEQHEIVEPKQQYDDDHDMMKQVLIFDQYPTLQTIASSTTACMIGLYFCSSWCPDCIAATPIVEKVIINSNDIRFDDNANNNIVNETNKNKWIDIIYISSDVTEDQMKQYKPNTFLEIPFHLTNERKQLKQYFQTCAMKEMNDCQMISRQHGIPTLILVNPTTGHVYTENGMDVIEKYHHNTTLLQNEWKSLLLSSSS
jgi:thiol-disulfide isomerase/thioredoxin